MTDISSSSRIFEGFRAVGLHSSHLPHVTRFHKSHNEFYVFTAVGKVFHTYNCSKLGLCQVSNQHPSEIECIAADDCYVYTACDNIVNAYRQNREVTLSYKGHENPVHLILPFGKHLVTVDRSSNVRVWHIATAEQYLSLQFANSTFEITAVTHPTTYLNKILFGSKQGKLQLWNISRNKMVYEFLNLKASPVTVLEQAPAIDVIGVGSECGQISLLNIRTDKILLQFQQECGAVTALSFRTDNETIMASGALNGSIYLWDLDSNKLAGVMENAHRSTVAAATFLPGQPLLLTNSGDNSVKVWVFENDSGSGKLLRERSGHFGSQTRIRFHKNSSIVSAGSDSTLRSFSLIHPRFDKNLGQASLNRTQARKKAARLDNGKLPPVVDFCIETAREGQWDGVIAAHYHHPVATTWNLQCARMGSHKFVHNGEKFYKTDNRVGIHRCHVSSIASTACGNFCLVGYNRGYIEVYNIQSGICRGSYKDATLNNKAHDSVVHGLAVDALNQVTISAGSEGIMKFWKFKEKVLLDSIKLDSPPAFINLHRGSSMLAVALDDFSLLIIDAETRKVVRHFGGHSGKINDITWRDDGRWAITCSDDCTIKTWDLPSVSMIDCFMADSAATSIALSPTSDLLATTHVDDVGIYLWSNRTLYGTFYLNPLPQDYHPEDVLDFPVTVPASASDEGVDAEEVVSTGDVIGGTDIMQLDEELITLSNLPYSKWANVLQLDNILKRNKPKEPPKVPKQAPFFLPTVASLTPHFLIDEEKDDKSSKIINTKPMEELSEFAKTLLNSEGKYEEVLSSLKSMGMMAVDAEIRSLAPDCGGSVGLLETFLEFIEIAISSNKDFEIIQAYLSLFLTIHAEVLSSVENIQSKLDSIDAKVNKDRLELSHLLNQNQCIVNFIKSATL